ncbi:DUF6691 family protein [Pelagicoccus mobilis]|uniref:YeeE/YedE family protein n=1 Tax=Pelagicoccus mobilis TaxID=415221 RepID=A0A934S1Z0_9BACT|nr:DUF6691 family protein [Pelagicoccus mobilis]MBK1880408.1 hypothetical protein [Pelagicoccus mobilis]
MSRYLLAFVAGALFALGLAVSGMSQPSKVRGFLDFLGEWDMTMLFVLGPAVGIYFLGTRVGKKVLPHKFVSGPDPEKMGFRFFAGNVCFGVGWGMVGLCPGPAIANLGQANLPVVVFFVCLLVGISVADRVVARL